MTFYRLRMRTPVLYGSHAAMESRRVMDPRRAKTRVTKVGFYSFAATEDEAEALPAAPTQPNGWESTARLLRVLSSAGRVPRVGHA